MKLKHAALLLFALPSLLAAAAAGAWDSSRLSAPVMINGHTVPHPVFAVYVMPGTKLTVGFVDARGGATLKLGGREIAAGAELRASRSAGLEVLEIRNNATGETCVINVFTMVPAARVGADGRLNGYRIGDYPREPLRGEEIYLPPRGFVEVTPEVLDTKISPNFTLGEFVAKQESAYPKYVVLRPSLLLKLEQILASLNAAGHGTNDFVIMSGYRTPYYNRTIGNVPYSRHVWGGAADFYIDESPADGRMDDLNGDGKVDRNDARWLAEFINGMSQRGEFGTGIGGIGVYGSNAAHGPFVHVDVRGTRARW